YAAFGAPSAHEDDAGRAVTAALELRAPPPELGFIRSSQIGIAAGTMRAGAYGGTTRRTYGALGDAVNLAARLMMAAAAGEVLASRRVQQAVAGTFAWEDLPALQVKGKRTPVQIARLVGSRPVVAGALGYSGPLIGRDGELAQLRRAIEPIFDGQFAGLVYVYGEAGMGKSRLVYELQQPLTCGAAGTLLSRGDQRGDMEITASWFTCPAESMRRQSLHPFRSFLRAYFDQDADGAESENKARFDAALDALAADLQALDQIDLWSELERARSFLGALVELRWASSPYEKADPHRRFERTLAAFRTLVLAESLRRPVILQIEDAHWLDDDSRQLLRMLTRDAAAYPLAVLLASRYHDDGSPIIMPVDDDVGQQAVELRALAPEGIRALAAHVLGAPVADDLTAFLAAKTNGNPFFVEQLALDLRERGLLVGDRVQGRGDRESGEAIGQLRDRAAAQSLDATPYTLSPVPYGVRASITAVLIARLDRLSPILKAVVQTAAVLGHEFDIEVLVRILPDDADTAANVRQAEDEPIWA